MQDLQIVLITGDVARPLVDRYYEKYGSQSRARDTDLFFVAMIDQEFVGCVRYCVENEVSLLRSMMIDESYRRKGIGARLLERFCSYLDENGIHNIYCLPYTHLEEFYRQKGFIPTASERAPPFLAERLREYAKSGKSYLCMRRP